MTIRPAWLTPGAGAGAMTKHAGQARLSDQALLDRIEAVRQDVRHWIACPCAIGTCVHDPSRCCIHRRDLPAFLGRALAILDEIQERQ